MLDTDQLRSFVAIVDTGSFTRAAERVNKTQSAVSMHIRRLEEQLGRPLFAKQGRGVRLSDDGEKLVDYARQMLQIEAAGARLRLAQGAGGADPSRHPGRLRRELPAGDPDARSSAGTRSSKCRSSASRSVALPSGSTTARSTWRSSPSAPT